MKIYAGLVLGVAVFAAASTPAAANGIIVVPVQVDKPVVVTHYVSGHAWQATHDGRWQLVPALVPVTKTVTVRVDALAIVPNPERPCYKPPKPLPPPITPTPQDGHHAAPAAPAAHEHEEGRVEPKPGGCMSCFPDCFLEAPCECCIHDVVVLERGSEDDLYFWKAINKNLIAYRIIHSFTRNPDGSYTFQK